MTDEEALAAFPGAKSFLEAPAVELIPADLLPGSEPLRGEFTEHFNVARGNQVVVCRTCGQKNRLPNRPGRARCGKCKSPLREISISARILRIIANIWLSLLGGMLAIGSVFKPAKCNWLGGRVVRITFFALLVIALLTCAIVFKKSQQSKAQERVRAGEIYWKFGQKPKAILAYKEALRFDSGNPDIWCRLGAAYQISQDFPEAIKAYQKAADLAPREARIQESLGKSFDHAGLSRDARTAYHKALFLYNADLSVNPSNGFLYDRIGDLEQRLGDPEKAAAAYHSAFAFYLKRDDPEDWFEWENLGDAWLRLGRPDDAIAAYERGVSARPSIESIQIKLRKLKYVQGR